MLNTIITSLKALDESFSSRNHVRNSEALPIENGDKGNGDRGIQRLVKAISRRHLLATLKGLMRDPKRQYVVRSWVCSDSGVTQRRNICSMAHQNEVRQKVKLDPDNWIQDIGCTRHMKGNKDLFSSYKIFDGGNVLFGSNNKSKIIGKGYSPNSKAYVVLNKETMKVKESLNVKFDETPPPNLPPLVDDDLQEVDIIENQRNMISDAISAIKLHSRCSLSTKALQYAKNGSSRACICRSPLTVLALADVQNYSI
ncbi:hypothetical protein Tco_1361105 [Tanacetum coccineum]